MRDIAETPEVGERLSEDGIPISERRVYAATPFTCDEGEWRGPLLPEESRRFVVRHYVKRGAVRCEEGIRVGIADIRIWNGPIVSAEAVRAVGQSSSKYPDYVDPGSQ